jgi:hypothetical protein
MHKKAAFFSGCVFIMKKEGINEDKAEDGNVDENEDGNGDEN